MTTNSKIYYQASSLHGHAASVSELIVFIKSLPISERIRHSGAFLYSFKEKKNIIGIIKVSSLTGEVSLKDYYKLDFKTNSFFCVYNK